MSYTKDVEQTSSNWIWSSIVVFLLIVLIAFVGLFFYKQYTISNSASGSSKFPIPTSESQISPTLPIPTTAVEVEEYKLDTVPIGETKKNNQTEIDMNGL